MTAQRDRITTVGLYVVGGAAAILSFTALADLAWMLGVRTRAEVPAGWLLDGTEVRVAWLLPLAVDVFAFTAARVLLLGRANADAVRLARRAAWSAIGTTVALNGLHGALTAPAGAEWWLVALAVAVSAIPAVALGALVHLVHLLGRGPDQPAAEPARDPWAGLVDDVLAEPWHHAIAAWSGVVDDAGRPVPSRDEDDAVLAADLRSVMADQGGPLTRDEVIQRYGVGATRATRLREMAARPTVVEDGAA